MKTILVVSQLPELGESIRGALNPDHYRIVHRFNVEEAEPLLNRGLSAACVVDVELANVQGIWMVEKVRRRAPDCPLLVFTGTEPWEWEEEAYLKGVRHVLSKPVRARMLNAIFDGIWASAAPAAIPGQPLARSQPVRAPERAPAQVSPQGAPGTLGVLRDLSAVLSHSLCAEALLKQFLLLLREIIGVNRSVIFLRQPASVFGDSADAREPQRLRSACAIGLPQGLLEHFELSLEAGIGGYVYRQGRILRRDYLEVEENQEIQKEFQLLGAQVAIPILDRETLIGVAAFDGRVTGEPLSNVELELVFHLLEALGLAIRNIWLHDQLAENHEMMADILQQLSSGCLLVGRDLTILHANKTVRSYFTREGRRGRELEFSDLPQVLGSKVYQVLKTGTGVAPFKYSPPDSPNAVYQISVVPFQKRNSGLPNSALLIVEDHTQSEQLQRLEIEAANLRLIRHLADRMAHEIGNALVPISTHQQLLAKKYDDAEFRASLNRAMADAVLRIARLSNQMSFLARDNVLQTEPVPVAKLIEEAFEEAQKYVAPKPASLVYDSGGQTVAVSGDRAGLRQALSEVMLNALQASPPTAPVQVRSAMDTDPSGSRWVRIEVRDSGSGFTPETARRAAEPFFSTRNVGLGLGLAVTRKIIETHRGKIEFSPKDADESGTVRISLPMAGG
jgi:signal transduction histidine kinase/ActR/RegA family two-component response regulator